GGYLEVRVHERLGSGSFGDVYRVEPREFGGDDGSKPRMLALKLLRMESLHEPDVVERFRREAKYLRAIESPHVVRVHGFGRFGPGLFIAMELIEGQTLRKWISASAPVSVRRAATIVRDIARGLAVMHAKRLIHRD